MVLLEKYSISGMALSGQDRRGRGGGVVLPMLRPWGLPAGG